MKDFAESFYLGKAWQACRQSYVDSRLLVDGGLCEECHEDLGYIVHHRTWLTPENIDSPDVSLDHGNLEYVCLKCHNRIHGHFTTSGRRCVFDANGDVIGVV